jgi:hypothetical protein
VATVDDAARAALLRRGLALEYVTLAWNVVGIIALAIAAVSARSVALAGFGLDSLIEIGASTVVIWELPGTGEDRQRRGLRLIGYAFAALAAYLLVQSTVVLVTGYHPRHSVLGIAWTSVTAAAMFALAFGNASTGKTLGNPVLQTEGRVTLIDGILAIAVPRPGLCLQNRRRHPASPVIRPGCGGIAVRGEQVEKRADPKSFLGGVPEQVVAVHGVPGAAAGPGAGEVARGFQVGHDDLDGALGEVDGGADVADSRGGGAGDLHQHVPVPGQQRPAAAALVRDTHTC